MSLNNTQLGIISSTFYFTAALSAFPAGITVDRYGAKRGLLLWLGLTSFPLLILSLAHSHYYFLLIMVAMAGLGYGIGNPVASKGLFMWFDKKIRGTVFGIRQSAITAGGAVASLLLVRISERSGPFIALRIVSWMILVMMMLAFIFYKDREMLEVIPSERESKEKPSMKFRFRNLFGNRALNTLYAVISLFGITQGVVITFFLLYVNEELRYPLITAGFLLTILMISGAVGRIFWGVVSDRLFKGKRKPILVTISALSVLSVSTLALWCTTWPYKLFVLVVMCVGLSTWGWNSIAFVTVTEISASKETATSVGLGSTFGWFGISFGPIVFGLLTDHFGYFYAWMSLAVICTFSLMLSSLIMIYDANT
jgi:sugar phosphate permease